MDNLFLLVYVWDTATSFIYLDLIFFSKRFSIPGKRLRCSGSWYHFSCATTVIALRKRCIPNSYKGIYVMYFSLYFGINFRVFYLYCVCVLLASSLFQFDLLPSYKVKAMSCYRIMILAHLLNISLGLIIISMAPNYLTIVFLSLKLKGVYDRWIKNKNKLTMVHIQLTICPKTN